MPRKRKVGRPPTGRGLTGRSALVRFSVAEYDLIQRAIAQQATEHGTAGMVGGKAVTVASFARHAAVGVAQRILEGGN
jgi:hypothetical protein